MKFYYYSFGDTNTVARIVIVCEGKTYNRELETIYRERIAICETMEIKASSVVTDVIIAGSGISSLRKDGSLIDDNGKILTMPKIKEAIYPAVFGWYPFLRGVDGKLYNRYGKEMDESALILGDDPHKRLQKNGKNLKLVDENGKPYVVSRFRLTELDTKYMDDSSASRAGNKLIDTVEVESEKFLFTPDCSFCLFTWNGLTYSLNKHIWHFRNGYEHYFDVAYCEEYDFDEIEQLIDNKIYLNKKGRVVFLDGWNPDQTSQTHSGAYSPMAIKAKKWENVVYCQPVKMLDGKKHLFAKTKDGRILNTFDPDIGAGLKNVEHTIVTDRWAFIVTK